MKTKLLKIDEHTYHAENGWKMLRFGITWTWCLFDEFGRKRDQDAYRVDLAERNNFTIIDTEE